MTQNTVDAPVSLRQGLLEDSPPDFVSDPGSTATSVAAVSPEPASIKSKPGDFIRLCNRIAGQNRPLSFPWNGQKATLSFVAIECSVMANWSLVVDLNGRRVSVGIERLPDASWLAAELAGIELDGLPSELACGVLEAAFEPVIESLKKGGLDVKLLQLERVQADFSGAEVIPWTIERNGAADWMKGFVSGDNGTLQFLGELVSKVPAQPVLPASAVSTVLALSAGSLTCSRPSLAGLAVNDVLLPDLRNYQLKGQCLLLLGGRSVGSAALAEKKVTIDQLKMASNNKPDQDNSGGLPVGSLEVELSFVVGQITLTFEELQVLKPGFSFELPAAANNTVTILANGKPVGQGELLSVGDRTGVRVLSFAQA